MRSGSLHCRLEVCEALCLSAPRPTIFTSWRTVGAQILLMTLAARDEASRYMITGGAELDYDHMEGFLCPYLMGEVKHLVTSRPAGMLVSNAR